MLKKIRWKFTLIGLLVVLSVLFIIPSLTKNLPSWWSRVLPSEGMRLGLDLQGGMHLILKVDLAKATKNYLELSQQDLRESLRKKQIPASRGESAGLNRMTFLLPNADHLPMVQKTITEEFTSLTVVSSTPKTRRDSD